MRLFVFLFCVHIHVYICIIYVLCMLVVSCGSSSCTYFVSSFSIIST